MELPEIALLLDTAGAPMVQVDEQNDYTDLPALIAAVPALKEPAHATTAAAAVNHLAEGYDYELILDPDAFRTAYYDSYDAEEDGPAQAGQPKLRDYGRPDLSPLAVPQTTDETLVFFAKDLFLGIAYRVTYVFGNPDADYQPVQ
ncbi:MAG: hypothetical protein GJ676_08770 [Rhodobacteraceae bacterium]|nr:hypothetical protein [Paracoccaceae bacterium]